MTTNWLLIVWTVLWLPLGAGLYLWRRQVARRAAGRTKVPVEVLSTEEELARTLRKLGRK